jgi:hypothetical protein
MPETGNSPLLNQSFFSDHFDSAVYARQCLMFESGRLAIALLDDQEELGYEEFSFQECTDELFLQSKIAALKPSLPAVVIFRSDYALLLPEVFRETGSGVFHPLFPYREGFEMVEHKPASFPASLSFPVPSDTLALVKKWFPGAVIIHHSLPVFKWMMNHAKLKHSAVLIELKQERLFLYAVKDSAPLFYNSFDVHSAEDVAYYTLLVLEQLEMDPIKQTVYFKTSGADERLLAVCRSFIPAMVPIGVMNSTGKHAEGLWFPFLIHGMQCG